MSEDETVVLSEEDKLKILPQDEGSAGDESDDNDD